MPVYCDCNISFERIFFKRNNTVVFFLSYHAFCKIGGFFFDYFIGICDNTDLKEHSLSY